MHPLDVIRKHRMKPVNKTAARVSGLWEKGEQNNKKMQKSGNTIKKRMGNKPENFTICKYCNCHVLKKRLRKHYAKVHGDKVTRIPAISNNKCQSKEIHKTGNNAYKLMKKICSKCDESYIGKRAYLGDPICPSCKH